VRGRAGELAVITQPLGEYLGGVLADQRRRSA
jgi:hypothetical protein